MGGYARPTADALKGPNSSKNVPARTREWTRVPHLSFPRNEGVPGSSPGVGLQKPCKVLRGVACNDDGVPPPGT